MNDKINQEKFYRIVYACEATQCNIFHHLCIKYASNVKQLGPIKVSSLCMMGEKTRHFQMKC